ncbi:MAG: 5-oxoprolinase subunit PxpB [Rhodocyclaceae bacterium]|nr:5-oxoprolinase subunit PxpB [Rhodocyclaceae bacterium]MBX3668850.1 5-oxoprolinase subunit PxpB [Rhodocyclaceae bacterium]
MKHQDLRRLGDRAFVIEFGDSIDEGINLRVHACAHELERLRLPGVLSVVPTFNAVTIHYDPLRLARSGAQRPSETMRHALQEMLLGLRDEIDAPGRDVEIPARFGGADGPDMAEVAAHAGLTAQGVVELYCAQSYKVYMMGFAPGFAYLGGLPTRLHVPRRGTPRLKVPAGSVAIGGAQTGVYPMDLPGGWNLIGRTGARLFDLAADPPCLLQPGDRVRFIPEPAE